MFTKKSILCHFPATDAALGNRWQALAGSSSRAMSESKCNDENRDVANSSIPGWAHIDFKDLELGDYLSGGGVGMVYKGWYKSEQVALKTLFDSRIGEDLKKEYMDELLVMSRVKHSNIVKFLGACMTPPNLCFVMEMCECSLYDILHVRREKLSEKDCVHMLTDVGAALEYLHAQKPAIIHRDVKSHNILRGFDGSLKLCDFGLVKVKSAQAGTPGTRKRAQHPSIPLTISNYALLYTTRLALILTTFLVLVSLHGPRALREQEL